MDIMIWKYMDSMIRIVYVYEYYHRAGEADSCEPSGLILCRQTQLWSFTETYKKNGGKGFSVGIQRMSQNQGGSSSTGSPYLKENAAEWTAL